MGNRDRLKKELKKMDKYQWPANKLTNQEMAVLHKWREKTGTPINRLLQQAVIVMDKIIQGKD